MTPAIGVSDFVRKWELNADATEFLSNLPDKVQEDCIDHFAGGKNLRDVNRRFISFARSRLNFAQNQNGLPIRAEVASFFESWGIEPNNSVALLLNKLPEKLFNEVTDNFAPRVQPRNPEALLKSFIESRALRYIPKFLAEHGLARDANLVIRRLTTHQLLDVICNFNPQEKPRNPTAMFIAFANARTKGTFRDGVRPSTAQINKFAKQWNMKPEFVKNLVQHWDPMLASTILTNFQVRNNTTKPESLFRGFVKSRVEGFAKKLHPFKHDWNTYCVHASNTNNPRVAAYCAWLGLNTDNTRRVASMSSTQLEAVMANFRPSKDTRNINSLFSSYIKRESSRVKENDKQLNDLTFPVAELAIFAAKWELSPESRMLLSRVPFGVGRAVLSEFRPRHNVRNPDNFVAAFIKNRCKPHIHAFCKSLALNDNSVAALNNCPIEVICDIMASYEPVRDVDCDAHFLAHVLARMSDHFGDGKMIKRQGNKTGTLSPHAATMVTSWNLNDRCTHALARLTHENQDAIAKEFKPRTNASNVSALFQKFLRLKTSPEPKWRRFAPISVAGFMRKFDLDSSSMEMMKKLTPELQQDIINTFRPNDGVWNMDSLLRSFTQSRLEHAGQTGSMALEQDTPTIDDFVGKWGLGNDARDILAVKEEKEQRHIIHSFRPRRKNNVEELFMSYTQSKKVRAPMFAGGK